MQYSLLFRLTAKKTTKLTYSLCRESPTHQWIPCTMGSIMLKVFPCHDSICALQNFESLTGITSMIVFEIYHMNKIRNNIFQHISSQTARFLGLTLDPPGSCRPQVGPMLAPWTLISVGPGFHYTVYPKKYAQGFCFAVLCCGYTLTDFPISTRLTSLALWQSNDCPSAGKATLMNMDKYFMWNHYERLHNHNKAKHNKTVCIFIGIYCMQATVVETWLYESISEMNLWTIYVILFL